MQFIKNQDCNFQIRFIQTFSQTLSLIFVAHISHSLISKVTTLLKVSNVFSLFLMQKVTEMSEFFSVYYPWVIFIKVKSQ